MNNRTSVQFSSGRRRLLIFHFVPCGDGLAFADVRALRNISTVLMIFLSVNVQVGAGRNDRRSVGRL